MCIAGDNPAQQSNPKESSVFSLRGNKQCIEGRDMRSPIIRVNAEILTLKNGGGHCGMRSRKDKPMVSHAPLRHHLCRRNSSASRHGALQWPLRAWKREAVWGRVEMFCACQGRSSYHLHCRERGYPRNRTYGHS